MGFWVRSNDSNFHPALLGIDLNCSTQEAGGGGASALDMIGVLVEMRCDMRRQPSQTLYYCCRCRLACGAKVGGQAGSHVHVANDVFSAGG